MHPLKDCRSPELQKSSISHSPFFDGVESKSGHYQALAQEKRYRKLLAFQSEGKKASFAFKVEHRAIGLSALSWLTESGSLGRIAKFEYITSLPSTAK
jgi:hypothetical protein